MDASWTDFFRFEDLPDLDGGVDPFFFFFDLSTTNPYFFSYFRMRRITDLGVLGGARSGYEEESSESSLECSESEESLSSESSEDVLELLIESSSYAEPRREEAEYPEAEEESEADAEEEEELGSSEGSDGSSPNLVSLTLVAGGRP